VEGDREGLAVGVDEEEEEGLPRCLVGEAVEDSVALGERELATVPVVETLVVAQGLEGADMDANAEAVPLEVEERVAVFEDVGEAVVDAVEVVQGDAELHVEGVVLGEKDGRAVEDSDPVGLPVEESEGEDEMVGDGDPVEQGVLVREEEEVRHRDEVEEADASEVRDREAVGEELEVVVGDWEREDEAEPVELGDTVDVPTPADPVAVVERHCVTEPVLVPRGDTDDDKVEVALTLEDPVPVIASVGEAVGEEEGEMEGECDEVTDALKQREMV